MYVPIKNLEATWYLFNTTNGTIWPPPNSPSSLLFSTQLHFLYSLSFPLSLLPSSFPPFPSHPQVLVGEDGGCGNCVEHSIVDGTAAFASFIFTLDLISKWDNIQASLSVWVAYYDHSELLRCIKEWLLSLKFWGSVNHILWTPQKWLLRKTVRQCKSHWIHSINVILGEGLLAI